MNVCIFPIWISLVVEMRHIVHKTHGVKRDSPREILVGFQISWGNAGLSEGKLFSFKRIFPRAFHLLCLKNYLFIYYWSLVGLQCFVSFRCTAKWFREIHIFIYLFFFRFFSLIGYYKIWSRVLVLYSMSLLVIYFIYSSVYMLIPHSSFTHPHPHPPRPPPLVTISLLSMSVGLFLFCK